LFHIIRELFFFVFCSETRLLEIMENLCPDNSKKEVWMNLYIPGSAIYNKNHKNSCTTGYVVVVKRPCCLLANVVKRNLLIIRD